MSGWCTVSLSTLSTFLGDSMGRTRLPCLGVVACVFVGCVLMLRYRFLFPKSSARSELFASLNDLPLVTLVALAYC